MLDGNLAPAALEVSWAAWAGAWHLLLGTCCLALASVAGWQASTKWSNGHRSLLLQEACRQAAAAGAPVWFEPVSAPKSTRATALLSLLSFISPNEQELAAMAAAVRQQGGPRQQQEQPPGCAAQCSCPSCSPGSCTCNSGASSCTCCCSRGAQQGPAAAEAAAGGAGPEAALLAGMAPDIATLLLAGLRHIVLTLGASGAALCTLAPDRRSIHGG